MAFKLFKFPAQNLFYSTILFLWVRTIRLVNLQSYLLSIHVEKIVYQMNKASIISILGRNVGRYLKMTDTIPEGSSVTRLGFYWNILAANFLVNVAFYFWQFNFFTFVTNTTTNDFFWATFGNNWGAFYSNIWLHWNFLTNLILYPNDGTVWVYIVVKNTKTLSHIKQS